MSPDSTLTSDVFMDMELSLTGSIVYGDQDKTYASITYDPARQTSARLAQLSEAELAHLRLELSKVSALTSTYAKALATRKMPREKAVRDLVEGIKLFERVDETTITKPTQDTLTAIEGDYAGVVADEVRRDEAGRALLQELGGHEDSAIHTGIFANEVMLAMMSVGFDDDPEEDDVTKLTEYAGYLVDLALGENIRVAFTDVRCAAAAGSSGGTSKRGWSAADGTDVVSRDLRSPMHRRVRGGHSADVEMTDA